MSDAVVTRVNGPVVEVSAEEGLAMLELVHVGPPRLAGELVTVDATHGAILWLFMFDTALRHNRSLTIGPQPAC